MATGTPVALATKGTVRLARGLASSTKTWPSFTAYCTFSRPTHLEGLGQGPGVAPRAGRAPRRGRVWGGRAQAESPEWTPASSTCSMTPAMSTSPACVAHGVDVDLDGVLQEPVDQHRPLGASPRPPGPAPADARRRPSPGARRRRRRRSPSPGRRARSSGGPAPGSRPARRRPAPRPMVVAVPPGGLGDAERARTARSSARGPRPGRSRPGLVPSTSAGGSDAGQLERRLAAEGDDDPGQAPALDAARCSASITLATSSAVSGSK